MAKNVQLQNVNEVNVYPKTYAKNVYFNDGKTLEDKIFELLHGENIIFEPYQLRSAKRYSLGGVIIGNGLSVDENGVVNVEGSNVGTYPYTQSKRSIDLTININSYSEV